MAILKAGTRLKSAVCSTEIMVVAAPKDEVELTCGGAAVIELGADAPAGRRLYGVETGRARDRCTDRCRKRLLNYASQDCSPK